MGRLHHWVKSYIISIITPDEVSCSQFVLLLLMWVWHDFVTQNRLYSLFSYSICILYGGYLDQIYSPCRVKCYSCKLLENYCEADRDCVH